jgi:hypothetical protein
VDDLITPIAAEPAAVPPGLLRRYLVLQKWRSADAPAKPPVIPDRLKSLAAVFMGTPIRERAFDRYVHSAGRMGEIEIVLPRLPQDTDLPRHIESAILTLSKVERRSPEDVIASIRAIGFDRVSSRVPDALVINDAIHLEIAADHIRDMKNLLAATATTELRPNAYFLRVSPKATEYADHCRFGHTFRGSFGFTIESPLVANDAPTLPMVDEDPPFERRVIQRFARGVQSVCEAAEADDTNAITESVATGFSANACELFAKLIEETSPGGLLLSFAFSPEWRAAPDLERQVEFQVNTKHIEVTRAAAKVMREKPLSRPETVSGRVIELHSDNPLDLLSTNSGSTIVVMWNSEDLGEIPVLVPLSPTDYLTAVDAHKVGRAVKASGTLERKGRTWILSYVSEFTLAKEDA